jgi:hypothetical protein
MKQFHVLPMWLPATHRQVSQRITLLVILHFISHIYEFAMGCLTRSLHARYLFRSRSWHSPSMEFKTPANTKSFHTAQAMLQNVKLMIGTHGRLSSKVIISNKLAQKQRNARRSSRTSMTKKNTTLGVLFV